MSIIKIAHNAVNAKLIGADAETEVYLMSLLSFAVADMSEDARSTLYNKKLSMFPTGFIPLVKKKLTEKGHVVRVVGAEKPKPLGPANPVVDNYPPNPHYAFHMNTIEKLVAHGQIIAQVATGGGKCLGKDTPVLMFDGMIKKVQDIVTGDVLMGPDSTSRRVLSTCAGRESLYRVTPVKGDSYVVNASHILSLKTTSRGYRGRNRDGAKYPKGVIVNVNVEDYLTRTKTFRHTHKGWRTGVEFSSTETLPVDPYLLGVILGDGTINGAVSVTSADSEIVDMLKEQAATWGVGINIISKAGSAASAIYLTAGRSGGVGRNPLLTALRSLGYVSENGKACRKFIPHSYKTGSRANRLALLAGILDTDGYYDGKAVYLTLKDERLFDDTLFLVRSLGFAAYKRECKKTCCNNGVIGTYFSMVVVGATDEIPVRLARRKPAPRLQKKDHLVTGISVSAIGEGDYYGFEIDGDHLFMLGDFTVTHNTRIARLAFARIRRPTLFLTTRGVLMHQMKKSFESDNGRKVGVLGDGEWSPRKGINVGMVQTFMARLKDPAYCKDPKAQAKIREKTIKLLEYFEFVILEEAHEVGDNGFFHVMGYCRNAHFRLALTATPFMRNEEEANMRLMACAGPIGIKVSEKYLIDCGILARPIFKYVPVNGPANLYRLLPWQAAYKKGIVDNTERNELIVREVSRATKSGLTVMVLVQHKRHGEILNKMLTVMTNAKSEFIYGAHEQKTRSSALGRLSSGKIQVLIGSTILDVGVDVPSVGMVVLAGSGKAEIALRQRVGRGLRAKKDGPNVAFIVDFTDSKNIHLRNHASQRRAIIESTEGFKENILMDGADFDYSILGQST